MLPSYEQNMQMIESQAYDRWLDADLPEDDNRQEDEAEMDYQIDRILDAQIDIGAMI